MRFWNKYIYDIPELVGDTILQIEGNISFVVLLLYVTTLSAGITL